MDMLHRRPTCPIRDRHSQSETNMPAESNRNLKHKFKYTYDYIQYILLEYWNNVRTLIRHDGLQWGLSILDL